MRLQGRAAMAVERPHAAPCVLVVDDEPEVRAFICEILESKGYRTRALDSGAAALELAASERPALILLDLFLLDLDGYTWSTRSSGRPAPGLRCGASGSS
jgi:CheY-like chemotaxis protein